MSARSETSGNQAAPSSSDESRYTFFRQSGWMVVATVVGGLFMFAVHKAAKNMPDAEYGVFLTLLQVLNLMQIPALGLQTVFAQQTVTALAGGSREQLTGAVRAVALATFLIWLCMAGIVFGFRHELIAIWKVANPVALWITLLLGLGSLWLPILLGILQGRQDFLWLGWAAMLNGLGRLVSVTVVVLLLGGYAAGAITGALIGLAVAAAVAFWHSRDLCLGVAAPFNFRPWLAWVVPLTLGLGASQFMLSADMLIVQALFDKETTRFYGAAGMIGRGLVAFTTPMMIVMFPKIARSAALSAKTEVLALALGATALLGAGAALLCTVLPALPLLLIYDRRFLTIAPLVPWFAWCMLPLTLSNVLINGLLARQRYRAVPWLVLVAASYGLTLLLLSQRLVHMDQYQGFKLVVQVLGGFSLALLLVSAWFTWGGELRRKRKTDGTQP